MLKEHNPQQAYYYQHVVKAEKTGDHEVTFTFDETGNRELPHIVGQLLILPKHYWEGTDAKGKKRDITRSTLEPPLGSGPTGSSRSCRRARSSTSGCPTIGARTCRSISARTISTRSATSISATRRSSSRRSRPTRSTGAQESTARVWATGYDFPAVKDKRVVLDKFEEPYRTAGLMVGFIFNLNRDPFKDPRVRQAFNLAFPFEDINKTLFYGQYVRLEQLFRRHRRSPRRACPRARELELLEEVRAEVPPEVFTEVYKNPDQRHADQGAQQSPRRR